MGEEGGSKMLPMLAAVTPPPISFKRMKQIFAQLSAPSQHRRLATDLPFFKQQSGLILSVVGHLQNIRPDEQACKQLFAKEAQLLQQLVSLTAAALQQLAAQLDREVQVSRTAALLADMLGWVLTVIRARSQRQISTTPSTADAAKLRMVLDRGLLAAYAAAARAAANFLDSSPQIPRLDPAPPVEQALLQLMDNPAHVVAAASNAMIQLWNSIADLLPIEELLPASSPLLESVPPAAALALALARAYAGDTAFCAGVTWHVLTASITFAGAAVSGPADTYYSLLARQEVFELLLLGFAVGTGLLHAEYKGVSRQSLLPSMRATDSSTGSSGASSSRPARSSSSKAGKARKLGRLVVSAHHQELLHALVGVRQLAALDESTASLVASSMWLMPHAVCEAGRLRMQVAYGPGVESGSTAGSRIQVSSREVARAGELLPPHLALPLLLTQVEQLALAPPNVTQTLAELQQLLSIMAFNCDQLRALISIPHWRQQAQQQRQPQQWQPDWSPGDTAESQLQLCVQSVWLQLGPALLSLCRRSSGEAVEEDEEAPSCTLFATLSGEPLRAAAPRQVFATFSEVLMTAITWQVSELLQPDPSVNLAVVVGQNPLLACSVVEAALHAAVGYSGPLSFADAAFGSRERLEHAGSTCFAVAVALPLVAEATAERAAAAAPAAAAQAGDSSSWLEQKMFCMLVAALKYVQTSAALTGPAEAALGTYYNALALLSVCCSAAVRMLGPAPPAVEGASQFSSKQQLPWFQVLGRALVAAGPLLQLVSQHVSAAGSFVLADAAWPLFRQFALYGGAVEFLAAAVTTMHSMLQQGGAAAAAVAAGSAAAAATPADLERLLQQAAGLQQQLVDLHTAFSLGSYDVDGGSINAPLLRLHAACQEDGLPQQLYRFGVACCAAFPQRGCCGNPTCTNLDKFTETALASQGCSGCDKAVKFCSAACHKTAWKQGHKAACAILKQRRAAAEAAAAHAGV